MKPIVKRPTKSAGKAVKARQIWSNGHFAQGGQVFVDSPTDFSAYFLLPASPEAVEQMASEVSKLIYRQFHGCNPHPEYERGYIENAHGILALLGLAAHRGGGKRGGKHGL